jgi:hypothetical protein
VLPVGAYKVTVEASDFKKAVTNAAGALIGFEARGPILGFNMPEALILQSSANSIYHGLQLGVTRRFSKGFQFNTFYTWSKSSAAGRRVVFELKF